LHGIVSAPLPAEELDVNGSAEPRIEEHVPARMAVVVVDIDAVAIPFPVTAARNVVRRDDPIGIVVEDHMTRARIEAANDNDLTNARVTAARMVVANASSIVIPIVSVVVLVPAFLPAVVVAIAVVIIVIAVSPEDRYSRIGRWEYFACPAARLWPGPVPQPVRLRTY